MITFESMGVIHWKLTYISYEEIRNSNPVPHLLYSKKSLLKNKIKVV